MVSDVLVEEQADKNVERSLNRIELPREKPGISLGNGGTARSEYPTEIVQSRAVEE
jgi:hypothetical protein